MAASHHSEVLLQMNPGDDCLSGNALKTVEQFEHEKDEQNNSMCCSCFNRWWNGRFKHQRAIVHIVEKTIFHVGIIVLVLIDCLLVVGELMLDFIYLSEKCDQNRTKHSSDGHSEEVKNHDLELAIEILHFGSIGLLAIFVAEVLIKIYAFGKKWWNIKEKKMEWLDALIVIVSFVIDIYFLKKPNVIAEISLLFISFRLWRIIRIINSVAQSVRSKDEQGKKHLTHTYIQIIELLLNVSLKKTQVASELRRDLSTENFDQILERFTSLDQSCRTILAQCHASTSKTTLADVTHNLQETLEHVRRSSSTLTLTNRSKTSFE